jgi:hypothetical protein
VNMGEKIIGWLIVMLVLTVLALIGNEVRK